MTEDQKRAKEELIAGGYTCVICRRDEIYCDTQRGVKPLLDIIDSGARLSGFSAADKVIGKATALLYVMLGVSSVYTPVISEMARDVLLKNGIEVFYDKEVARIKNRTGDGFCPMETAVMGINKPHLAYEAIKKKLAELEKMKSKKGEQ